MAVRLWHGRECGETGREVWQGGARCGEDVVCWVMPCHGGGMAWWVGAWRGGGVGRGVVGGVAW